MNRDFIKFIVSIAGLMLLVLLGDRCLAAVEDNLYKKTDTKINYATYGKHDDEIVILGSSRARHHYNTSIIAEKTGHDCVNLGMDGQNIYYAIALLQMYLKQNSPKLIILDLFGIDFQKTIEKYKTERLADLSPLYHKDEKVDSIIGLRKGYTTQIDLLHSYRYNGKIVSLLVNPKEMANGGFIPLNGIYPGKPKLENISNDFDEDKLMCIAEFITLCKKHNAEVCVMFSPALYDKQSDRVALNEIESFCKSKGCKAIYNNEFAIAEFRLFKDVLHLNEDGAEIYSALVADELKELIDDK